LFRRANLERLNYLFSEVIVLARTLGLIRLGLIALDGTKIRANAAVDSFKKAEHQLLAKWRDSFLVFTKILI